MSLTESLIAAAVISTSMAMALPSLSRTMAIYKLQSAAHEVATRMQSARISSISRNRDCRIAVTSAVSYVIECQETSWHVIDRVTVPEGVTVEANARPEFHRRGNVSPTATITLRNRNGGVRRVIVNVNGRLRIQ